MNIKQQIGILIRLYTDIGKEVREAAEGDRKAQKLIYNRYSGRLLSICRQYVSDDFIAEDLMISSFMKIFKNLLSLENSNNPEPWMKKVAVNECLTYLRSKNKFRLVELSEELMDNSQSTEINVIEGDLQTMLDELPDGCRAVFNLYVVEGYKHHEIAVMLEISEGTSKSQLAYARKLLKTMIQNSKNISHGG